MSNVPPEYADLENLSASEIELRVQELRAIDPKALTDEQLSQAVALHAIARRKTSGPPKTKGKSEPVSLDALGF